jgi:hypothetical protein
MNIFVSSSNTFENFANFVKWGMLVSDVHKLWCVFIKDYMYAAPITLNPECIIENS